MTGTQTIQELAREAAGYFERARRATGEVYVRTRESTPAWVSELVHDAHGDMLPDDWRYDCIAAALEAIADSDELDDAGHEFADGYADVYTGALVEWLGSHGSRPGYCDEAADEYGYDDDRGITGRIQLGQYAEALEVFGSVLGSLEQRQSSRRETWRDDDGPSLNA